jgi:predicted nucleic acid-binding protein
MKRTVLDSSALMSFYEERPGAHDVEILLHDAMEGKRSLSMSVVNWGEIFYSVWRVHGREPAERVLREIAQLPIDLVDADPELTRSAAEFRARHKLPYVDCFVASLAKHRKADLATSDKDFSLVENELPIRWIPAA